MAERRFRPKTRCFSEIWTDTPDAEGPGACRKLPVRRSPGRPAGSARREEAEELARLLLKMRESYGIEELAKAISVPQAELDRLLSDCERGEP
jgi:hypothetical protein